MIILGIDPGTTRIGFGIVEILAQKMRCLNYGIISNAGVDRAEDMLNTEKQLLAIIKKHKPEAVAIEKLFFLNNQKTAMSVSELRGVLLLTIARSHLPVYEFTPLQVKQSVSNYGRADKKQVEYMVRLILGLKEQIKPDDAADALAIAICGVGCVGNKALQI